MTADRKPTGPRRPTLADVAAAVGVHTSLVSRVLRDDPRGFASAETRSRILETAEALGYTANVAARGLRNARTTTLGLLLPGFTSPMYTALAKSVEEHAAARSYGLVLGTHAAGDPHETITNMLMQGRVDAMLVASGRIEDKALRRLAEWAPHRVVLLNRQVRAVKASVVLRDGDAAALAVQRLADLGHRRIGGVFGPPSLDTMVRRRTGTGRRFAGQGPRRSPSRSKGATTLPASAVHSGFWRLRPTARRRSSRRRSPWEWAHSRLPRRWASRFPNSSRSSRCTTTIWPASSHRRSRPWLSPSRNSESRRSNSPWTWPPEGNHAESWFPRVPI